MIRLLLIIFTCLQFQQITAQVTPTPDKLWGDLFSDVQLTRVFADNKTFVDCTPKYAPAVILKKYHQQKQNTAFDLKAFVLDNFNLPATPAIKVTAGLSITQHLEELWNTLSRKADSIQKWSSLLPLPDAYIVPGGRFREIYYWDSYFTMQGLAVSNRYDLIKNMLDNFTFLINKYGHIPNGNRNYYLSRSQPPYFALMVSLFQEKNGDAVFQKYYDAMEKEYNWWMQGQDKLKPGIAFKRVVKLADGSILNRHWDDNNSARQESYAEDMETSKSYLAKDGKAFVNLRAGAESGWDFSSRWFGDTMHLNTIETTDIIPVDLNALLYANELILAKAATATRQTAKASLYKSKSEMRRAAISKYCWNGKLNYFFDYNFKNKGSTNRWSAAGAMPLFCKVASTLQAAGVEKVLREKFVKNGGVVTTIYNTGQQWDAPNGWAPLQFIAVQGLINYKYNELATTIAERWMAVNENVFTSTGKMLEKYNVENTALESGGGEYPTQDGFGWSNGVYLKFYQLFKKNIAK